MCNYIITSIMRIFKHEINGIVSFMLILNSVPMGDAIMT